MLVLMLAKVVKRTAGHGSAGQAGGEDCDKGKGGEKKGEIKGEFGSTGSGSASGALFRSPLRASLTLVQATAASISAEKSRAKLRVRMLSILLQQDSSLAGDIVKKIDSVVKQGTGSGGGSNIIAGITTKSCTGTEVEISACCLMVPTSDGCKPETNPPTTPNPPPPPPPAPAPPVVAVVPPPASGSACTGTTEECCTMNPTGPGCEDLDSEPESPYGGIGSVSEVDAVVKQQPSSAPAVVINAGAPAPVSPAAAMPTKPSSPDTAALGGVRVFRHLMRTRLMSLQAAGLHVQLGGALLAAVLGLAALA